MLIQGILDCLYFCYLTQVFVFANLFWKMYNLFFSVPSQCPTFLPGIFFGGGGVNCIVMQSSFAMLIFPLLWTKRLRQKSFKGQTFSGMGAPCRLWKKARCQHTIMLKIAGGPGKV